MSSDWSYIALRLNGDGTQTFLDFDVPLSGVGITDVLSGPGGLTGTIDPEYARLKDNTGQPMFQEWSTAIFAQADDEIRGGGILTHSGFDGPKWELECTGLTGYAKDMPYVGPGQFWTYTDTLDIYRAIWAHIQSQPGSNIGLTFAPTLSGKLVGSSLTQEQYDPAGGGGGLELETQAYKLRSQEHWNLEENLIGLATDTPFDYHETHYWEGEDIKHRVDFGVPTIGERREDLRFTFGENLMVIPGVERGGEDFFNEVHVQGAGEGQKMIIGKAFGPRTRLRRVKVMSDPDLRITGAANRAAQKELAWRMNAQDFTEVQVVDSPHASIGSVNVGDEIRVNGETGWLEADDWFRVISRTINPDDANVMQLTIARSDRLAS